MEINQSPMMESHEERKKQRPICRFCKDDHTYQDWSDAMISFANPEQNAHLGCLQIHVRSLELQATLALENSKSLLQHMEDITESISTLSQEREKATLRTIIQNLEGALNGT
jgi:hypothetical protein